MKPDVFPPGSSLCCVVMSEAGSSDALQSAFWWGDGEASATAASTAEAIVRELYRVLGEPPAQLAAASPEQGAPPPTHVAPSAVSALALHADVLDDPAVRLAAASGSAYPDLVRRRRGELVATPDLVLRPRAAESVAPLVAACAEHDVALVPRGGGTSLSGGVDTDDRGGCATLCVLDLRVLARVIEVDPVSRRVIVEPGVSGPELEQALRGLGLEVPHHPESFRRSTVGGWVATGALGPLLRGAFLATPVGIIETGGGPAASGGPDLLATAAGGEGSLGIVTRAELTCRARPEAQAGRALQFRDLAQGLVALRRLAQDGLVPELCELSDEDDMALAAPGLGRTPSRGRLPRRGGGALLVLGSSGRHGVAASALQAAIELCSEEAPRDLGVEPARLRVLRAYDGPHVRDAAIEAGFLADRLDIAATWRALPIVREALIGAIDDALGQPCLIGCRITHPAVDGARLCLRVFAPVSPGDEVERWRAVQGAAFGALLEHGAGLAPGRGVGKHASRWLARAHGRTSGSVLRALKDALDPLGVLNPGVLINQD
jgi:alkyldihydroxyacetonephosphate synthase